MRVSDQAWIVMKFGGTSVAGPAGWRRMVELVNTCADSGNRIALVCSAIRGVTELLEQWLLADDQTDRANLWSSVQALHHRLAKAFGIDPTHLLDEAGAADRVLRLTHGRLSEELPAARTG